jgi:lipoprotein
MLEQVRKYSFKTNLIATVAGAVASCVAVQYLASRADLENEEGDHGKWKALGIVAAAYAAGTFVDWASRRVIEPKA